MGSATLRGFQSDRLGLRHSVRLFRFQQLSPLYRITECSQRLEQVPLGRDPKFQVNIMFREVIFHICLQHHQRKLTSCPPSSHCASDSLSLRITSSSSLRCSSQRAELSSSGVPRPQHILRAFHCFSTHLTYWTLLLPQQARHVAMWREETVHGETQSKLRTVSSPSLPSPHQLHPSLASPPPGMGKSPCLVQEAVTADSLSLPSPDVVSQKP